jgi:hypothetical protein
MEGALAIPFFNHLISQLRENLPGKYEFGVGIA